jgi:hypothetical protein
MGTGSLPPGLALSPEGSVTGTPSSAGAFGFTAKVTDAAGSAATGSASVTVYRTMTVTQACLGRCSIGVGCTRCGGFGTVTAGLPPYGYRILGGGAPPGMTLSGLVLGGGFPAGTYSLSVQVTDKLGAQATVVANWSIYGPAKLSAGGGCSASANPPFCTAAGWSYSGGHPTVAPKVVIVGYSQYCDPNGFCYPIPTTPPPQWSAVAKGGVVSISAGGVACNAPAYGGYVTLALVDTTVCATTQQSNQAKLLVNLSNNC